MTSTLPQRGARRVRALHHLRAHDRRRRKQPITWPVTPYYRQGAPTIDVTTGLGYPKKADDARAPPEHLAALLGPDRLGHGERARGARPGDGDGRRRGPEGQRGPLPQRVRREAAGDQEDAPAEADPRAMFNWYYARIYIKVRPERVFVWPEGDLAEEPVVHDAHLEEVRSGHVEEPAQDHGAPAGGSPAWDKRMDFLDGARDGRAQLAGPGRLPDRGPRPLQRGRLATARSRSRPSRRACRCSRGGPA